MKGRIGRKCKRAMQAAKALLEVINPGVYIAGSKCLDEDGWLDYYTHEPLIMMVRDVSQVVETLKSLFDDENNRWEWRLFAPEGSVNCAGDGKLLDPDDNPIDGTNALLAALDELYELSLRKQRGE